MITRRQFAAVAAAASCAGSASHAAAQDRTVVLTFDDAVKSHVTFVAPLLKDLGFNATFFVTHRWMDDAANFMTWSDVARIHSMGFEIGNHSWTHAGFSTPKAASRLEAELALVDRELSTAGVPKPVSFAWCGNAFCPEALEVLERLGYQYARRGMQPEMPYGQIQVGPAYDPAKHDRLLIPTTGDAYPDWTLDHFDKVIARNSANGIVVLQFHGVPDVAHPWVHTPPDMFEKYMRRLKSEGFRGIAMRDLAPLARKVPPDPMRKHRYPEPKDGKLPKPLAAEQPLPLATGRQAPIAPFPGHEHPRAGFLEGAIAPARGTKVMAFLPWDPDAYVVIDVPEAIFSGNRLLFLAHSHIPTIWDARNMVIEDRDWVREGDKLVSKWTLPDTLDFGVSVFPASEAGGNKSIQMELWFTNKSKEPLTALRSQVCVLLKRATGFHEQTDHNREFGKTVARVRSAKRSIAVEWENCGRTWGNPQCPCIHSDPVFSDCPPGETVRARGRLWFEG